MSDTKARVFDDALIRQISEAAELAFWEKISELVPEAESGDFSWDASFALSTAINCAVSVWVRGNTPSPEAGQ